MSKKIRYGVWAIVPFLMLVGLFGTVSAQGAAQGAAQEARPLRGRRVVHGQIVSIESASLTIQTRRGELQVDTDEETRFRIIGQEEAGLDDFNVGDRVLVRGIRREDGRALARWIALLPDGDHVLGRIIELAEDGLILRTHNEREVNVAAGPDTTVVLGPEEFEWVSGQEALSVGMPLVAFGTTSEDGLSLEAHTLVTNGRHRPRRAMAGSITSIDDQSFTLSTLRGEKVTVLTTAETRFRLPGIEDPNLADFATGDLVVVVGQPGGEGQVTARLVAAVPENRPPGRPVIGRINEIEGRQIILRTANGNLVTIVTDADTRYRVGDDTEATLADFSSGDIIAAFGQRQPETNTLLATHVMKRGERR